jgi:hypothetical protein
MCSRFIFDERVRGRWVCGGLGMGRAQLIEGSESQDVQEVLPVAVRETAALLYLRIDGSS